MTKAVIMDDEINTQKLIGENYENIFSKKAYI